VECGACGDIEEATQRRGSTKGAQEEEERRRVAVYKEERE
jgi:hypothetical protein